MTDQATYLMFLLNVQILTLSHCARLADLLQNFVELPTVTYLM